MIPAGIISGTEAFWYENQKWIIHNGHTYKFEDAPGAVQRQIADAFMADKRSINMLKNIGITTFTAGFDRWYKCVVGALDSEADFENDTFKPDVYNSSCNETDCVLRGKLCGTKQKLQYYEVATIDALRAGYTMEQASALLCVSLPGLKSRIQKIREKLNVPNMASMMAIAGEIGI